VYVCSKTISSHCILREKFPKACFTKKNKVKAGDDYNFGRGTVLADGYLLSLGGARAVSGKG